MKTIEKIYEYEDLEIDNVRYQKHSEVREKINEIIDAINQLISREVIK